jgi:hypothetical protein
MELDEFETADPALVGEMTITFTPVDSDGGTDVLAVHEVPACGFVEFRQRGGLVIVPRQARRGRRRQLALPEYLGHPESGVGLAVWKDLAYAQCCAASLVHHVRLSDQCCDEGEASSAFVGSFGGRVFPGAFVLYFDVDGVCLEGGPNLDFGPAAGVLDRVCDSFVRGDEQVGSHRRLDRVSAQPFAQPAAKAAETARVG